MRIGLPSLSGLKVVSNELKEIVKILEDMSQYLSRFTSNGVTFSDNVSYTSVIVTNSFVNNNSVTVEHNLKRVPVGYMIGGGGSANILDASFTDRSATFYVAGASTTKIILL